MKISEKGFEFIKSEESLALKAYLCPAGVLTIGYGHTSAVGAVKVYQNMRISAREAEALLHSDLRIFEATINDLVKVPLNQSQFDALVSLVMNIGPGNFTSSTLLKKLNKKDYAGALAEFPKWNKITVGGKKKVSNGLVNRRAKEVSLWLQGEKELPVPQGEITRTVPDIVNKENVSFAAGIVGTAVVPLTSGSDILQYALAGILTVSFTVALYLFLKRRGK